MLRRRKSPTSELLAARLRRTPPHRRANPAPAAGLRLPIAGPTSESTVRAEITASSAARETLCDLERRLTLADAALIELHGTLTRMLKRIRRTVASSRPETLNLSAIRNWIDETLQACRQTLAAACHNGTPILHADWSILDATDDASTDSTSRFSNGIAPDIDALDAALHKALAESNVESAIAHLKRVKHDLAVIRSRLATCEETTVLPAAANLNTAESNSIAQSVAWLDDECLSILSRITPADALAVRDASKRSASQKPAASLRISRD